MQIVSLNVSLPKEIEYRGQKILTGIFKEPVNEPLFLRELNFDGDAQADLEVHGGIYKAVYAYPYEHYATWQHELGRSDFVYGQFGENITLRGLLETDVYIGNIYRMGEAHLQVTQPRVPCYKLGIRMGDPTFVKRFMKAERSGFYLRVLQEGEVNSGEAVELLEEDPNQMSVLDIHHLLYFDPDPKLAARALKIEALSPGWRGSFEAML
jgi:MOSC domain-containing protein YiiM